MTASPASMNRCCIPALLALLGACSGSSRDAPPPPPPEQRTFTMGFSPWPFDASAEAVD